MNDTAAMPPLPKPTAGQIVRAVLLALVPFLLISFPAWPNGRAKAAPPRTAAVAGLMPAESIISLEIPDVGRALAALENSSFLAPARRRGGNRGPFRNREMPLVKAIGALCYSFDLPYRDGLVTALATRMRDADGPAAFGLIARGDRDAVPVLAVGVRPESARSWSARSGLFATVRDGLWIATTRERALASFRPGRPLTVRNDGPVYRLRIRARELFARRARGLPQLGVLHYMLGALPEVVEISWENGRERIRVSAPGLTDALVPYGDRVRWPGEDQISLNFALAGRLDLPDGFGFLRRALARHPLGVRRALIRAWPTEAPTPIEAAKHLTGRFQVISIFNSQNMVPVIGLELRNPQRAIVALDKMLLASGICERYEDEMKSGQLMYVLRKPAWVDDHQLRWFIRRYMLRYRQYRVAYGARWLWLGPKDEVEQVLRGLPQRGDDSGPGPSRRGRGDEPSVEPDRASLGAVTVGPSALWRSMIYELNDLAGTYPATEVANVMDNTLRVIKKMTPQRYEVTVDGDGFVLSRRARLEESMLPMLVARGVGAHEIVRRAEESVRAKAQSDLRTLLSAQFRYRERRNEFAPSIDQLERVGLWRPAADPDYGFRLEAAGKDRLRIIALPRRSGPTGWRPAFAIRENGAIYSGSPDAAWTDLGPDSAGARDQNWSLVR